MMVSRTGTAPASTTRQWRIRPVAGEKDAMFLSRLWHHYFGAVHDYSERRIPTPLAQTVGWCDELPAVRALVATADGVRVGGGVAIVYDHDDLVEELPDGRFNRDALAGEANGWLALNAVDPSWRGQGIGGELFRRRLAWFADQDVDMVFAYGWEREKASSRPLFERFEFVPVTRLTYEVGGHRDACPDCGVWPSDDHECTCEFTLWALDGTDLQKTVAGMSWSGEAGRDD